MKIGMILGLAMSSLIISGVSAMDMHDSMSSSTGMMMTHDTMMSTGSMATMTHDTMTMVSKKPLGSVVAVAKNYGYVWSTDRMKLAKMAGIMNYRGTAKQNIMIRDYLLKMDTMLK